MALIAEQIDSLTRVTVRAYSDPKKPPKFPEPFRYPRPGEQSRPTTKQRAVRPSELFRRMTGR